MDICIKKIIIFTITLFIITGSSKSAQAEYPKSLIIYPGAKSIVYYTKFPKYPGSYQVSYQVHADYPAVDVISVVSSKLTQDGWDQLKRNYLDSSSSMSVGWVNFVDSQATPNRAGDQWISQWKNSNGEIVTYVLTYSAPKGEKSNRKDLVVFAAFYPAGLVNLQKEEWQKNNQAVNSSKAGITKK